MNRLSAGTARRLSAALGFLGVALGAFGAHALQATLIGRATTGMWEKAVFYHFIHAAVMLVVAGWQPWPRLAWSLLGAGVIGFSGSLYLYALTGVHWLVFLTPIGGFCLLAGWLVLAFYRPEPLTLDTVSR